MGWLRKRRTTWDWVVLTPATGVTGMCAIRRDGDLVTFLTNGLTVETGGNVTLVAIPPGYLPRVFPKGLNSREGVLMSTLGEPIMASTFNGGLRVLRATAGRTYEGVLMWQTGDTA